MELIEAVKATPGWYIGPETIETVRREHGRKSGRGRRGYPPEHWRKVASVYAEAYVRGESPTLAVAEHFEIAKATAGKWVSRAREAGFLAKPPGRGRAGGIGPMIGGDE